MDDVAVAFWGSRTLPRLLAHLTDHPGEELTLSQLQTALGANRESLHRALQRALVTGLVTRRRIGNLYVYRADESSPYYAEVKSLTSKMLGAAGILTDALRAAASGLVEQAFIYGSTARRAERRASDIDVMVVGAATDFDLVDMLQDAIDRIPRAVNALVYRRDEVEHEMSQGNSFLLEVWARPKLMLIGREEDLPLVPEGMRR